MRMWLAVDCHAGPSVLNDANVSGVDVLVGLDEVVAENGGKELGRVDGVLFRHDIGGLLHGVRCNHDAVVGFGISARS